MGLSSNHNSVLFFREAAPYIQQHRHKTFVIAFAGEVIESPYFPQIAQDLAIISSLGSRLVLVHGTRPQIDQRLQQRQAAIRFEQGLRVTDKNALLAAQEAIGFLRIRIENLLSHALNIPTQSSQQLGVVSGNFITARPVGIHNGVDYGFSGMVRKMEHALIRQQLQADNIVLVSPMGYSPTGEAYNLRYEQVAIATAQHLHADKLIFLSDQAIELPKELTLAQAQQTTHPLMPAAIEALENHIERVHLLDANTNGSLLLELYTRDGGGSLISAEAFEQLRPATIEDISGILALIQPLENAGALIKRSREQLELEVSNFHIINRDNKIIACVALYQTDNPAIAELACFAVHPDYRGGKRGDKLLKYIEKLAKHNANQQLMVLTTQTTEWFRERGFQQVSVDALPDNKKQLYNYQRNSRVLFKPL